MDPTIRKFNYEALIRHVKQYPAVFDSKHEMHKNRAYVNELWRQIAEGLHSTDTLCREKWANLRSNYMRETRKLTIRRIEGKPLRITWPYFSLLEFLNPSFHKKISIDMALAAEPHDEQRLVIDLRSESNSNSHQGSDDIVEDAPTITVSSYCEENTGDNGECNVKRKKRSWRQVDTSTTQNSVSADNDTVEKVTQRFPQPQVRSTSDSCATCNEDNDRLFLLSLLPFMKQMNTRANLEFRTEVQQLLQKKITSK